MDRIQKHKDICKELNDVYAKKNHDYGNSFGETFNKLGVISAVTRISDKYNRLVSLCTKSEEERQVKDESITDTLLDMANYCIMTVIELHKDELHNDANNNNIDDNDSIDNNIDNNDCDHHWEYVAHFDNALSTEFYNCTKCGITKPIKEK